MIVVCLFVTSACYGQSTAQNPIHQLRIYEIFKDNKQALHERFKDHTVRIMKNYGFQLVAIWETEYADKLELVYLLEWKDESTMTEAWKKFKADQEWIDIKKKTSAEHGTLVGEIEDRVLTLKDYSPSKSLLK